MPHEIDPIAERSVCRQVVRHLDSAGCHHLEEAARLTEWLASEASDEKRYRAAHIAVLNVMAALRTAREELDRCELSESR